MSLGYVGGSTRRTRWSRRGRGFSLRSTYALPSILVTKTCILRSASRPASPPSYENSKAFKKPSKVRMETNGQGTRERQR